MSCVVKERKGNSKALSMGHSDLLRMLCVEDAI